MSIVASWDSGYTVTFNIKDVTVFYKDKITLRGWINHHNELWYFPLSVENKDKQVGEEENNPVNNIYEKNKPSWQQF